MNFEDLIADKEMILPCHYTPGRSKINKIVLHHNAGNLTTEDCYHIWQNRKASAHYQVEYNGTIGQLVNDWDTAWHAGSANPTSIGIEHANSSSNPWRISDATLEAGAHLVAALCKNYDLGEPEWGVNVFGHSHFMATACPGEIAGTQNATYMARAKYWYKVMMGQSIEGWEHDLGGWWYRNADGTYPKNEWKSIAGKWYFFDTRGYMKEGWIVYKDKWYYLQPQQGYMIYSTVANINGKYFAFDKSGAMMTDIYTTSYGDIIF